MQLPSKYIHDRLVLLLLSINSFLLILGSTTILLRLGAARSSGYIVGYRVNLGVNPFIAGRLGDLLAFIVFMFIVFGVHTMLSVRIYPKHRDYAVSILSLGTLLLILTIIVSNALLVLR